MCAARIMRVIPEKEKPPAKPVDIYYEKHIAPYRLILWSRLHFWEMRYALYYEKQQHNSRVLLYHR